MNDPLRELLRFLSNVTYSDGCWEWQGQKSRKGYGKFWTGNIRKSRIPPHIWQAIAGSIDRRLLWKSHAAHRWLWTKLIGPIGPGLMLCHHCDNPPCVRPSHMFLGTAAENNRDCVRKGRNKLPPRHDPREWAAAVVRGEIPASPMTRELLRKYLLSDLK